MMSSTLLSLRSRWAICNLAKFTAKMQASSSSSSRSSSSRSGSSSSSRSANSLKIFLLDRHQLTSGSNEKIKLVKGLQNSRKKRGKDALMLLEGHRQVIDALSYGFVPTNVLLTDRALRAPLCDNLMRSLSETLQLQSRSNDFVDISKTHILEMVSEDLMNTLAEVASSQGVIAVFRRPDYSITGNVKLKKIINAPLVVLLDRLSDAGNVGTIVRSAHGLGAHILFAVEGTADVYAPKSLRAAAASTLCLPVFTNISWELLRQAAKGGCYQQMLQHLAPGVKFASNAGKEKEGGTAVIPMQIVVADCDPTAVKYTSVDFTLPTMLVVGNESSGPIADARHFPGAVRCYIPMTGDLESLNAGVASSILLAEAARQRYRRCAREEKK